MLLALILRPVGFKYRSKTDDPRWRARWDWALFIGGFVPALVFGVAVGNVLLGVPFRLDGDLRAFYEGSFFGLLQPFALLCGLLSVAMLVHARRRLAGDQDRDGADRGAGAPLSAACAALAAIVLFALGGALVAFGSMGYRVTGGRPHGPSNPLRHDRAARRRLARQLRPHPVDAARAARSASPARCSPWSASARGASGSPSSARRWRLSASSSRSALRCSPSSCRRASIARIEPDGVERVVEPRPTLGIMLFVTVVFLPIVLVYTAWVSGSCAAP